MERNTYVDLSMFLLYALVYIRIFRRHLISP